MIIQGLPSEHAGQNTKSNVENLSKKTECLAADSVHETKWYILPDKPVNGVTVLRRPKARPVLISLHNELEIQSIFKSVSKFEGSGICITTDLLPVLNNLHSSLLIKGNDLRERGLVLTTRIKQKGAKIWSVNKRNVKSFYFHPVIFILFNFCRPKIAIQKVSFFVLVLCICYFATELVQKTLLAFLCLKKIL